MGRGVYSINFQGKDATTAMGDFDFFEIDPAAEEQIRILAIFIGNSSDFGDAQEEILKWSVKRFSGATFTSGGEASATPAAVDPGDGSAAATCESFNANGGAASSSGTTTTLHYDTFNVRTGLQFICPPDLQLTCDGASNSAIVVRCESTVADTITLSGTLYFREGM